MTISSKNVLQVPSIHFAEAVPQYLSQCSLLDRRQEEQTVSACAHCLSFVHACAEEAEEQAEREERERAEERTEDLALVEERGGGGSQARWQSSSVS